MLRFGLIFLVLALCISINLPEGFLARLGMDGNILFATLIALVMAGLIAQQQIGVVVLVVVLTIGANIPEEMALEIGFDPDYLMIALGAVVLFPLISRLST